MNKITNWFLSGCPQCNRILLASLHLRSPRGLKKGIFWVGQIWCSHCQLYWCDCCGMPLNNENPYRLTLSKWQHPFGLFRRIVKVERTNKEEGRNDNQVQPG
jgi:transposase